MPPCLSIKYQMNGLLFPKPQKNNIASYNLMFSYLILIKTSFSLISLQNLECHHMGEKHLYAALRLAAVTLMVDMDRVPPSASFSLKSDCLPYISVI